MSRILDDWLNAYLKYSEDSEPPQSYHLWIGLGMLAGALQRKVYMRRGRSTIYPNLYIILVGPSGRAKKGTALEFGKPIMEKVGITLVEGAITREKLIRRISEEVTNFNDRSTGLTTFQCAVTCISDELSVFLGQNNIKFLADLCNWYDCPRIWIYDTKGQGTDKLEGICFNLIGATAPDWLPSILPKEAVGGGFTSRVVWVVEEDKGKTVPEPTYDEELEGYLARDLERIYLLTGEFKFTEDGRNRYVEWYTKADLDVARGRMPIHDPKLAGYCERRATLIRKISMLVSISESDELTISAEQFNRALGLLERVEKKMPRVFSGLGSARYAYLTEQILNFVLKHKKVTRTQIMTFFFRDIDGHAFDVVIGTLRNMSVIDVDFRDGEYFIEARELE